MLPKRIAKKPRREAQVRCPAHRAWVRSHTCSISGCDGRPIECAHVRIGTDGGTGLKPGDGFCLSLCSTHHRESHSLGEESFERKHGLDLKKLAAKFAAASPALKRFYAKQSMAGPRPRPQTAVLQRPLGDEK